MLFQTTILTKLIIYNTFSAWFSQRDSLSNFDRMYPFIKINTSQQVIITSKHTIAHTSQTVFSKKILRWTNVCFVAHEAHAIAQPCRQRNSDAFPTIKELCGTQHRLQGELSGSWNAHVLFCLLGSTSSKAALEQISRAWLYFCRAPAVCRWISAFFSQWTV